MWGSHPSPAQINQWIKDATDALGAPDKPKVIGFFQLNDGPTWTQTVTQGKVKLFDESYGIVNYFGFMREDYRLAIFSAIHGVDMPRANGFEFLADPKWQTITPGTSITFALSLGQWAISTRE